MLHVNQILGSFLQAGIWIQKDQVAFPDLLHGFVEPRVILRRGYVSDRRFIKEHCAPWPDWGLLDSGDRARVRPYYLSQHIEQRRIAATERLGIIKILYARFGHPVPNDTERKLIGFLDRKSVV